jgi:hypothetical protein
MSYLGIPMATKRITLSQCTPLYEKISAVFDKWHNKYLSQAGRITLLKSVIFSMSVYWSRTFLLPSKLISMLRTAMINFLWSGSIHTKKLPPIAFSKLELPKSKGGLGMLNLRVWNLAAVSSHLNSLLNKNNTLWVSWCLKYNLADKEIWTVAPKQHSSWVWKLMLKVRDLVLPFAYVHMSTSSKLKFWFTPWLGVGQILGKSMQYDDIIASGIPTNAKAVSYIRGNRTTLPDSIIRMCVGDWGRYNHKPYLWGDMDKYLWTEKKSQHSIQSLYESLSNHTLYPRFPWNKRVWLSHTSERHNLALWKVLKDALHTKEKLIRKGINVNPFCVYCQLDKEDIHHLFFSCPFTYYIWKHVRQKAYYGNPSMNSTLEWHNIYQATRWKVPSAYALLLYLKVTVLEIWKDRNDKLFNGGNKNRLDVFYTISKQIHYALKSSPYAFVPGLIELWAS